MEIYGRKTPRLQHLRKIVKKHCLWCVLYFLSGCSVFLQKKTKKSKGQKKWNIKTLFFSPKKYYMQHQPTTENISFQLYQNCYLAMSKTNEKKNLYCFKVPIHITLTLAGPTDFGRTRRPSNMY